MTKYIEYRLTGDASEYLKDRLQNGLELARLLYSRVDLSSGTILTYLPEGIILQQLAQYEFPTGVVPVGPKVPLSGKGYMVQIQNEDANTWLALKIQAYLDRNDNHIVLLEDANANPSSPYLAKRTEYHYFTYQSEVYGYLTSKDKDLNLIQRTMKMAGSAHIFIAVMTEKEDEFIPTHQKKLTMNELASFADRTQGIAVMAYDHESYLIWDK